MKAKLGRSTWHESELAGLAFLFAAPTNQKFARRVRDNVSVNGSCDAAELRKE